MSNLSKNKAGAIIKILALVIATSCVYCNCCAQAIISITVQDSTSHSSKDFVDEIVTYLKHDGPGLEGKVNWVPPYEWITYEKNTTSMINHYKPSGRYVCVFKIKRGIGSYKNLSVKMIDLASSGGEHVIFDKYILKDDLDNAIDIIEHYHILNLLKNSGWKPNLYVLDNQKDIVCNNYLNCFDTLYYNPVINQRFYVLRREVKEADEIRCINDDNTKGPIQFIYLKKNKQIGNPLTFDCKCKTNTESVTFRKSLEGFFKIITQ